MDDNKGSIDRLLSNNDGKISNRAMIEKRRPNITPCNLAEELNDVNYKYFKIQLFHKLLIQFLNNWRGAERNNEQGEKVLKSAKGVCIYTYMHEENASKRRNFRSVSRGNTASGFYWLITHNRLVLIGCQ